MDGWRMDLGYAVRALRLRPGLTAVAVLTLALGVGGNAAIFSVVNAVLLSPFDLPRADRVAVIQDRSSEGGSPYRTTGGAWRDWRERNRTFQDLALIGGWAMNLTEPGVEPARVDGARVSASYFGVLGVAPALGRTFRPEENQGPARVVILSDALWRGRYGADPDIVGRTIMVGEGEAWEVIGVMPPVALPLPWGDLAMVDGARDRAVWVPLDLTDDWASGYRSHVFVALGRLEDGVALEAAAADLAAVSRGITEREPDLYARTTSHVASLRAAVVGDVRRDLLVLSGAVALLLLVACANLTNLLLARAIDRGRELAVRAAVGARRARLLRLGLLEALLLGLGGGVAGLLFTTLGLDALLGLLPADLPRQAEVGVDGVVVAFTLGISVLAGLLTGVIPAWRGARPGLPASLKAGGRGAAGLRGSATARVLVAAQLTLACTLLVGAGLLVRSVLALQRVDPGVRTERTLSVELLLAIRGGDEGFGDRRQVSAFLGRLEERVAAIPRVEAASIAYDTPLESNWTETFTVTDRPAPGPGERPGAHFRPVSPGYFEMMGIRLLRGRTLTAEDGVDGAATVVVNEAFTRRFFAGEEVLGRRLRMGTVRGNWGGDAPVEWEVVGVVEDVRFRGVRAEPPPAFYFSQRQAPTPFLHLLVRTAGDPRAVLPDVRAAVADLDPRLPLSAVTTLAEVRARATARDRFNAVLLTAFALTALLVAAAGVYGVLAYAVARRTGEMGVRLALGAHPRGVFGLLVGEGMRMAAIGLAAGLVGGVLAGRLLSGLLFGVAPWDGVVLGGVSALLAAAAFVSGAVPARRAARTDPAVALRGE
jgi:predicted permease